MTDEEKKFYADVAERAYVAASHKGSRMGGSCAPYFAAAAIAVREAVYADPIEELRKYLILADADDFRVEPDRRQAQFLYNLGARAPKKETK